MTRIIQFIFLHSFLLSATLQASDSEWSTLSVSPKNRAAQQLHSAALPAETEIQCAYTSSDRFCAFGLGRGFSLGADVLGIMQTPVFQPMLEPGKWLYGDVFGAYQFLTTKDANFFANAKVGVRKFGFEDSDRREISASGLVLQINYAQEVSPALLVALHFQGFGVKHAFSDVVGAMQDEGEKSRLFLTKFYDFSKRFPARHVQLDAELEIVNWKNSHIDLPNHLRMYVQFSPRYSEHLIEINKYFTMLEKNFALGSELFLAYESAKINTARRFAVLGGLGFKVSSSHQRFTLHPMSVRQDAPMPKFKGVGVFSPFYSLMATYQF